MKKYDRIQAKIKALLDEIYNGDFGPPGPGRHIEFMKLMAKQDELLEERDRCKR